MSYIRENIQIVKGDELWLFVGTDSGEEKPICFSTQHTLNRSTSTISISSNDHGSTSYVIPSEKSWSCSTEALMSIQTEDEGALAYENIMDAYDNHDKVYVKFGKLSNYTPVGIVDVDGALEWELDDPYWEGEGYITSLQASGGHGDSASFSIEITGNGPLVKQDYTYSKQYLTFEALEDTTFTITRNALQYSLDNGATWTTLSVGTASPTVTTGNKILWKQTGLTTASSSGVGTFSATGNFKVYGNIMSLLFGDDFGNKKDLTGYNQAFFWLFESCTKLVDASNLILPATTLSLQCYDSMFKNCSLLISAPKLPATTLSVACYSYMFYGCTSLTTAPELPATTLGYDCYTFMFHGCTSLNYIKCLATDISTINCTQKWVNGVSAAGTFVKAASMSDWTTGVNGIPEGWTVQNA